MNSYSQLIALLCAAMAAMNLYGGLRYGAEPQTEQKSWISFAFCLFFALSALVWLRWMPLA